jgi:hypothetical protein
MADLERNRASTAAGNPYDEDEINDLADNDPKSSKTFG